MKEYFKYLLSLIFPKSRRIYKLRVVIGTNPHLYEFPLWGNDATLFLLKLIKEHGSDVKFILLYPSKVYGR